MRNKEILIVKVKWSHHAPKEVTWEVEEQMKQKYPYLFPKDIELLNFKDDIFFKEGRNVTPTFLNM